MLHVKGLFKRNIFVFADLHNCAKSAKNIVNDWQNYKPWTALVVQVQNIHFPSLFHQNSIASTKLDGSWIDRILLIGCTINSMQPSWLNKFLFVFGQLVEFTAMCQLIIAILSCNKTLLQMTNSLNNSILLTRKRKINNVFLSQRWVMYHLSFSFGDPKNKKNQFSPKGLNLYSFCIPWSRL